MPFLNLNLFSYKHNINNGLHQLKMTKEKLLKKKLKLNQNR